VHDYTAEAAKLNRPPLLSSDIPPEVGHSPLFKAEDVKVGRENFLNEGETGL